MRKSVVHFLPFLLMTATLLAGDNVTPGELVIEPPTLICLGFEWPIEGDDNRNAKVQVKYRQTREAKWQEALPLLRLGGEKIYRREVHLDYTVPEMFAGSILDLEPDTEYECVFQIVDVDGVNGPADRRVKVRTRAIPKAASDGRILHVYPPGWKGKKLEPAFTGLKSAYFGSGTGDWAVLSERKVAPGDTILVHAGLYKGDRLAYTDPLGLSFHGSYILTAKGTPERPIVIRAAGDGEVIFDGDGCYRLFDVMAADYHIFEGLTVKNCDIAFLAGLKDVAGCRGLTVRKCRIEDVGIAVTTQFAGSRDFYIADNMMIGRDDRFRLVGWYDPGIYGASQLKSYYAVKVYGAGHVVCHNYIAFFHDGICVCTHGMPEAEQDLKAVSIDFYNNDIHLMTDDFLEADGGVHNIRIMRNRCVNAAQCGLSAQPVYGGPAYFIRNLVYHVPWGCALKFKMAPAGLMVFHNTIIAENGNPAAFSNAHFRNNLMLGTDVAGRPIARFPNATAYSTYDYNGYRPNVETSNQYEWKGPEEGALRDYDVDERDFESFATLMLLSDKTGNEKNGIEVDFSIFRSLRQPDADRPHAIYYAEELDFTLNADGKAVDAGVRLANVNDRFNGVAPDLGALESGEPAPVYGPRQSAH
jgi:hypothetical protein